MKKKSLEFRLVTGGILLVLIPLAIVGFISVIKAMSALQVDAREKMMNMAVSMASLIDVIVEKEIKLTTDLSVGNATIRGASKVFAEGVEASANEVQDLNQKLANAMKAFGQEYEALLVADTKGLVFADGNGGKHKGLDLSALPAFKQAMSGNIAAADPIKSMLSDHIVLPISAPIYNKSQQIAGVFVTLLKSDFLSTNITSIKTGRTGFPMVIDAGGGCIAHPDAAKIMSLNINNEPAMAPFARFLAEKKSGVESYRDMGAQRIAAFMPLMKAGGAVLVTQEISELMATADFIRNLILVVAGLFILLTAGIVILFARSLTRPIYRAIEVIVDTTGQVALSSSQVLTSSQALAEGASTQAAAIEETSASLEEMAAMTKQNSDNADKADKIMQLSRGTIDRANESIRKATSAMAEVTHTSSETQKIVKTIDEIAFQTNLLALNAAVEAARAGESGAGFAVVADEVRSLAMRAAEAAKNTSILIESSVKKTKEGFDLVTAATASFETVSQNSSRIASLIAEITAASKEQAIGVEQISKAVNEVDKVIQENAAQAEESSSISETMQSQASRMEAAVAALVAIVGGNISLRSAGEVVAIPEASRR